jgi:hypothetical protein
VTRRAALVVLVACLSGVLLACGDDGGDDEPNVGLDGSPRPSDAQGRLVEVADDFSTLTLDGDRTYDVAEDLLAFAAIDGTIQPLLRWVGQYVQVGVEDGTVVWLGGISAVVELDGDAPVAYFTDVLVRAKGRQATFRSGTVLTLAGGVDAPGDLPAPVVATIDVGEREVVALEPG